MRIYTESSTQDRIDESECRVAQVQPLDIQGLAFPEDLLLGENQTITLAFETPEILLGEDSIEITTSTAGISLHIADTGLLSYNSEIYDGTFTSFQEVSLALDQPGVEVPKGVAISISFGLTLLPSINSGDKQLTVTIRRNGVLYATSGLPFSVAPNTLTQVAITRGDSTVLVQTEYTFALTLLNPLGVDGTVIITLPN